MNDKKEERTAKTVPVKEGLFPWPIPSNGVPCLIGSQCSKCGQTFFPKRVRCPDCQELGNLQEISLSRKGTLYSYTIVRQAPPGFQPPYATALIDLPEGVRLFAQLTTANPAEIQMDGPVELTFGPIAVNKDGTEVISYKFRPINQG
jgi:uncharacterized OB-fold protein